jgi:hypothetical protein
MGFSNLTDWSFAAPDYTQTFDSGILLKEENLVTSNNNSIYIDGT